MTSALTDPEPLISPQRAEWDRRKFEQRWKNSSTPEEIEHERKLARERTERASAKQAEEREKRRAREAANKVELAELIKRFASFREGRKGFALTPGTRAAIIELLAMTEDDGERKWSYYQIGRVLGVSDQTVRKTAAAQDKLGDACDQVAA